MSGVLSLANFKVLNPSTGKSDVQLRQALCAMQGIVEAVSGLRFGSEVTDTSLTSGTTYRITYYGGLYEIGESVRLVGNGVSATPFEITDVGPGASVSEYWIEVESDDAIDPTRMPPILEYVGMADSGHIYCTPKPVFSVSSVKIMSSAETLWGDSSGGVTTVASTNYETFKSGGINMGVLIKQSAIPLVSEGGDYLVKRMVRQAVDGIKITYAAGFYLQIPADLLSAAVQIMSAILRDQTKGAFASENLDYYSYQNLSVDQLASLPHAAVSILRRYARL